MRKSPVTIRVTPSSKLHYLQANMGANCNAWSIFKLNNNTEMPALGLTLIDYHDESVKFLIDKALSTGYRCFDITNINKNSHLADIFKELLPAYELHRDDIYVIRRLKTHESYSAITIEAAYNNATKILGMDYIDLLMMPRPGTSSESLNAKYKTVCNNAWRKFTKMYDEGRVNAIGVSNFSAKQLQDLLDENYSGVPAVNLLNEWHPECLDRDVLKVCRQNEIVMQANVCLPDGKGWSPSLYSTLSKIASSIDKTPHQVLLVWNLQNDIASLLQSSELDQICDSYDLGFRLTPRQMNALNRGSSKRI